METSENKSTIIFGAEYIYKSTTDVQNLFLSEYMKHASEVQLKVYLYGGFLISNTRECTVLGIAKGLGISEEEVKSAFMHWEEMQVVKIRSQSPFFVEYLDLSSRVFKPKKFDARKYEDFNKELTFIITGRMINPNELVEYYNFIEGYGFSQEAFLLVASYGVKMKGVNVPSKYIIQTAINLKNKNIKTYQQVEAEFNNYFMQSSVVSDLLTALKIKRKVDFEDMNYLAKWKNMGFSEEGILEAGKLLKGSKSMEKLDGLLCELLASKVFEKSEITKYQNHKNMLYELAIKINKSIGVFYEVLETEVDVYIRKWVDVLGIEEDALLYIAENSFLSGVRTLDGLSDKVESFAKLGIITKEALLEFMAEFAQKESKIKKVLEILGLERKPNAYDRTAYAGFEKLGFSDDIIEYSAEKAMGTYRPMPYMQSILKNWKKAGVSTLFEAKNAQAPNYASGGNAGNAKKEEIISRNYTKEEIANAFSALETLDEF
ncbi:MAG: DnaD domain protein [Bacillota bacterium]